jgi:hypothetical protein
MAGIAIYLLFAPKPWAVEAPTEKVPYTYHVATMSWWGGLMALGGCGLLALTVPWWTRALPAGQLRPDEAQRAEAAARTPRWFWPLVAVPMIATAVMGAQRLHFSMWDDEIYTLRRFVVGDYREKDDGTARFREMGLGHTLHDYRKPNNHILHNLLARVSTGIWKLFRDKSGPPFSEAALRFPAYLFGIASVGALAWLLKELGLARAGVWAAFLLAAHPWHVRYASEGRGYSMVLFFLPVIAVFWLRAMRTAAWRWWIALAAVEFALLYTFPAALYSLVFLNLGTLLLLLWRRPLDIAPAVPLGRWLASSTVAGLAFIWLFLPCVPQIKAYVSGNGVMVGMGWPWVQSYASHLFAGVSWFRSKDPVSHHPELYKMATAQPELFILLVTAAAIFFLLGMFRLLSRGGLSTVVAVSLTLPAVLAFWVSQRGNVYLFEWYLLYLLIGTVALMACGLDLLSTRHAVVPAVLLALFLAGYFLLVQDAHRWLLTKPIQPLREAAMSARGTILPNYAGYDKVVTTGWPLDVYDPHGRDLGTYEEFVALVRECDQRGADLYVHFGYPTMAVEADPEVFRLATQSDCFEVVADLPGFDPSLDRVVCKYRRGSMADGR